MLTIRQDPHHDAFLHLYYGHKGQHYAFTIHQDQLWDILGKGDWQILMDTVKKYGSFEIELKLPLEDE